MSRPALTGVVFIAAFLLSLGLPSERLRAAEQEILIGLIPEVNVFEQMDRYQVLADYLTKKTGVRVNLTILTRYGNIIAKIRDRRVDGAFLGSFTGALAIGKLGMEPIARPVNLNGVAGYKGYILVRKDSGIRTIAEMRGKSIALVDRATTAGYIYPVAYLREFGVNSLEGHFREHYFTGSHDAAILSVLNREADVGAAKDTIFNLMKKNNPRIQNELVILAESPLVPSNGLMLRRNLDQALKARLKKALLELESDPEGKAVLDRMSFQRFIPTKASDYDPVFRLAEKAGIDIRTYNYLNN